LSVSSGLSKSNAVTLLIVGVFVGIVVVSLVVTYAPLGTSETTPTTTNDPITISGLTLTSGSASYESLNKTCGEYASLQISVTNDSPNIYYLSSVTIIEYHSSKNNGTVLTPASNGCLPVSETNPEVPQGADDVLIQTYPNVTVGFPSIWNVTINFSNGQSVFQPALTAQPYTGN
jgi:hypothetical protein